MATRQEKEKDGRKLLVEMAGRTWYGDEIDDMEYEDKSGIDEDARYRCKDADCRCRGSCGWAGSCFRSSRRN